MLKWTYVIAGAFLLGLVSFAITSSAGMVVTLIWPLGVAVLSLLFVRLVDSHSPTALGWRASVLMGGLAVGLGGLLKWLTHAQAVGWADAAGILTATCAVWAGEVLWSTGKAGECFVCKQAVGAGRPFVCPRCHQTICARPTCWTARHFRCRYCDEREVIIFPIDERWWRARLGPRTLTGTCGSCFKEAGEADLRECGQCRWPMCTRCWDYHNGQCGHCQWILPDLPAALTPFLGPTRPVARQPGPAARRRV